MILSVFVLLALTNKATFHNHQLRNFKKYPELPNGHRCYLEIVCDEPITNGRLSMDVLAPEGLQGQMGPPGDRGPRGMPGKRGPDGRHGYPGMSSGFTAKIWKPYYELKSNLEIIVFESVLTNYEDHYNSSSGIFTAPQAGIYSFTVRLTSEMQSGINGHLYKNNEPIAALYNSKSYWMYATVEHPLILEELDQVYVTVERNPKENVVIYGGGFSDFSGMLIREF
ncbi:hypothetical protein ACOME3_004822 [Neoechinorhynchus agilis]